MLTRDRFTFALFCVVVLLCREVDLFGAFESSSGGGGGGDFLTGSPAKPPQQTQPQQQPQQPPQEEWNPFGGDSGSQAVEFSELSPFVFFLSSPPSFFS